MHSDRPRRCAIAGAAACRQFTVRLGIMAMFSSAKRQQDRALTSTGRTRTRALACGRAVADLLGTSNRCAAEKRSDSCDGPGGGYLDSP